jgi:hypothetical protein
VCDAAGAKSAPDDAALWGNSLTGAVLTIVPKSAADVGTMVELSPALKLGRWRAGRATGVTPAGAGGGDLSGLSASTE